MLFRSDWIIAKFNFNTQTKMRFSPATDDTITSGVKRLKSNSLINERERSIKLIDKNIRSSSSVKFEEEQQNRIKRIKDEINAIRAVDRVEDYNPFLDNKIEEVERLLEGEMKDNEIKYVENNINFLEDTVKLLLTDEEKTSEELKYGYKTKDGKVVKGFTFYEARAKELKKQLTAITMVKAERLLNEVSGRDITIDDYLKNTKDISEGVRELLSINRADNVILNSISILYEDAMFKTKLSVEKRLKGVDTLIEKVKNTMNRIGYKGNLFQLYEQRYRTGEKTTNMISPYSPEFLDEDAKMLALAYKYNNEESWKTFYKFNKNNKILIDPRMLFNKELDSEGKIGRASCRERV